MDGPGCQSKGYGWMVRESRTGAIVGCIRLNSISRQASFAVVGYEYDKRYWGKGYATEALIAVTNHCHKNMLLYRLEAWTLAGNEASDRILQKAGFRLEGTQRQKMILRGQHFDQRLFGRLADDHFA
ncbi:GNAT family protein [Stappia sp. BW2]|uniref:GNAT family N-acetyltransferase n=1 Tax=Stappia sp. BW2 TaxID=2592622 RepID=UPI0025701E9A|nr:GNAT family protein [Stappia sp. BW2]